MRARLIVAIAGVAAAAVAFLAVPLGLVLQNNYRDDELLRLQRDTVAATREIDLSAGGDPVEVPPTSDTLAVYDRAGKRVAGRGPRTADSLVQEAIRSGRIADQHVEGEFAVAVPLLTNERVTGAARAVRDGFNAGSELAFLQSSELGHTVYRQLGFRDVEEYVLQSRPREARKPMTTQPQ